LYSGSWALIRLSIVLGENSAVVVEVFKRRWEKVRLDVKRETVGDRMFAVKVWL
jgi:hypothetical protein